MAKLTFALSEIIDIVKANISIPEQIKSISAKDDKIFLRVKATPLIPSINMTLTFNRFQDGKIFLLLETNKFLDLIVKIFKRDMDEWITINFPEIIIKVNELLSENVKELQIKQMRYSDTIMTIHT